MSDVTSTLAVRDDSVPPRIKQMGGVTDAQGVFYATHALRANSADVSTDAPLPVSDANTAAFQGVVSINPGVPFAPGRSIGMVIATTGQATFTFADGSTLTIVLVANTSFVTLPFACTNIAIGPGLSGSFWSML